MNLTEEQQQAVRQAKSEPLRLTNPVTNETFVLVPEEIYERLRSFLAAEYDIEDTYPAQMESAMRAGWGDPLMEEYNDYDAHRKQ